MIRFGVAEDFGLKEFKNVPISIDKCVSPSGMHTGNVASSWHIAGVVAHTHLCQKDPYFRYICIPNWAIKDDKGEPSVIFWHEYGHFLNPEVHKDCSEHIMEFPVDAFAEIYLWRQEYTKRVHGDKFKEIMIKLGKPELASPIIDVSNIKFYPLGEIV